MRPDYRINIVKVTVPRVWSIKSDDAVLPVIMDHPRTSGTEGRGGDEGPYATKPN